jgi:dihydroflavonol-4-reductase
MRVLVTGASGFVGAHSVAAIMAAGHEVRALVRSAARLESALAPLGVAVPEHVEGDCRDAAVVGRAMDGCDAVLSCASVFTWAARQQGDLLAGNRALAEVVLRTAAERGLDPIVHVSSYVALDLSSGALTEDSPVTGATKGYAASKGAQERIARELQAAGAPVVTTYPGAVLGPHDPYLGDSNMLVRDLVRTSRPPVPPALLSCVDVRDVGEAHARVLALGLGARRYLLTGRDIAYVALARAAAEAAGQTAKPVSAPAWTARLLGAAMDAVARMPGVEPSASSHALRVLLDHPGVASTRVTDDLGITYRPLDETLRDTVAWLRAAGHLRPRKGASPPPVPAEPG